MQLRQVGKLLRSIVRKQEQLQQPRMGFWRRSFHTTFPRLMGGYIEEAQLTMFGLDVYKDLYGDDAPMPDKSFVIPDKDERWPSNLWGFQLGLGLIDYYKQSFSERVIKDIAHRCKEEIIITESEMINKTARNPKYVNGELKRKAAVLVPLCNVNGVASLLFTVRGDSVSTHKGQVSFPGGHVETNEAYVDAAVRETYEEIGKGIGPIRVLGTCQMVPAITGTLVTPVIGYIEQDLGDLSCVELDANEVASVFTRPIQRLTDPTNRTYESVTRPDMKKLYGQNAEALQIPRYKLSEDEKARGENIWGLTAWIADAVATKVLDPSLKKFDHSSG